MTAPTFNAASTLRYGSHVEHACDPSAPVDGGDRRALCGALVADLDRPFFVSDPDSCRKCRRLVEASLAEIEASCEPIDGQSGWWSVVVTWPNRSTRPVGFAMRDSDLVRLVEAIENREPS